MLTLEVLQAKDGDCLLLRAGPDSNPTLILIDGGSGGVYTKFLKPRLEELRGNRPVLKLRMVMASHIDADHITGLVDMFRAMNEALNNGQRPPWEVTSLWHNAFGKVVGSHPASAQTAAITTAAAGGTDISELKKKGLVNEKAVAVVASVGQGNDLQGYATKLAPTTAINKETKGKLIAAPQHSRFEIKISDTLTFTVLGPRQAELDNLEEEWNKSRAKNANDERAVAADYLNRTIPNLSSIVVLAEEKNKEGKPTRILLTGDAGGDFILESLEDATLLDKDGGINVDVLKVQHHGSSHSVDEAFFRRVTADSYVISGNGKHGIPHMKTLGWLSSARSGQPFDVYMTNRRLKDGDKDLTPGLDKFLKEEKKSQPNHQYHFLSDEPMIVPKGK